MNTEKITTLVHCSSPTEGVLYARTFDHETEGEEMMAAFHMVREMAAAKPGRYWSMGQANMKMVRYTPEYQHMEQ